MTYAFDGSKVTGSYGDATAIAHADTTWTQKEIDDGDAPDGADTDTVAIEGLKTILIRDIKKQAASELTKTDCMLLERQKNLLLYHQQSQLIEKQLDQNKQRWRLQSQTLLILLR